MTAMRASANVTFITNLVRKVTVTIAFGVDCVRDIHVSIFVIEQPYRLLSSQTSSEQVYSGVKVNPTLIVFRKIAVVDWSQQIELTSNSRQ
jgi:hypothetical protein